MKNVNPKALAFWTLLAAAALAGGAYATTAETPVEQEITENESREVADLIQSKPEPIPVPETVQGKNVRCPGDTPRTKLVPKSNETPVNTTAQNT